MTKSNSNAQLWTIVRVILATIFILVPPEIFEKYTFYLYTIADPNFFNFSGSRLWFDVLWFAASGIPAALIVGRNKRAAIAPPLIASLLFIVANNVVSLCAVKECYVGSTDGLTPLRDFLLLGSLGVITSTAPYEKWDHSGSEKWIDTSFQLAITTLVGFALSFFPITHIFAGVSVPYPLNYLQWFLAAVPAGLAGSMIFLDRSNLPRTWSVMFSGISGVFLALALSVNVLPCESCGGYSLPTISIVLLAILSTIPAVVLGRRFSRKQRVPTYNKRSPRFLVSATISLAIIVMVLFYFIPGYQASVVNAFPGVRNSSFSPLEIGRTFVYSAGYLAVPRVTPKAVGVNVSFGNTTIDQVKFPNDFLAAGVGDQSPNCCKDGLDLAYRADVIEFSNGTEALLARGWWACDDNMACGGYSWQQLLFLGMKDLPAGVFSNWVGLEMNWTSSGSILWSYRISFISNHSSTPWTVYSSFKPPTIQNHYWDAGLFYLGALDPPNGFAYFFQFGISSAYPINSASWHVFMQCPEIFLNGVWSCISKAAFINGLHSYWKVIYTFGEDYPGTNFSYLGNYESEFYYSGSTSPADGTPMW